jgi:Cytochrome P450
MAFKEAMRLIPCDLTATPGDARFRVRRLPHSRWYAGQHQYPLCTWYAEHLAGTRSLRPLRFTEEASRGRHKFAYAPFGGGAHICRGLHFAYTQAKCFAYHLLGASAVSVPTDYQPRWQMTPIPRPSDGLKLALAPI